MPNLKPHPEMSSTSILRFLDQIDISLWACTSPPSDTTIVDSIAATFTSDSALSWYRGLVDSVRPRRLTINDFRRALLRDFGIENWEVIMARYDNGDYCLSQDFMLKLSYFDEIEGLKDQIKFRNRRALEDRRRWDEAVGMWERVVAERDARIMQLEAVTGEGRWWKEKGKAVVGAEGAFARFERNIETARERFKEELGIEGYGGQNLPFPPLTHPLSYPLHLQGSLGTCPKLPPIKPTHWPTPSSLENIFEAYSPQKRTLLPRTPLKSLNNINANKNPIFSPGVAFTKVKEGGVAECDELLREWDKELLLLSHSGSSVSER